MLRITTERRNALWVVKLEGRLQGEWVGEVRRSWQGLLDVAAPASIRVELADVQFVDAAGKGLLEEMHSEGVGLTGRGCLARAICEEIVAGPAVNRRRGSTS
jgi:anti-anti-sigma regulatory factor